MSQCKSCGAEIVWVKTRHGKWIPCDEGLVPYKQCDTGSGSVVLDDGTVVRCDLAFDGEPSGLARVAHFATCPDADKFRRRQK